MTFAVFVLAASSTLTLAQTGNTTLGTNAGDSITTGDDNVFVGENAGTSLTVGSRSVFIGKDAGRLKDNETDLVIIGWMASSDTSSGFDNVIIGSEAGMASTGGDNTFVGSEAGRFNTSGFDNTFLGEQAGFRNTTGDDNVFIGQGAGGGPFAPGITGSFNIAIGSNTMRALTNGFGNTAIGNDSGFDLESGIKNTYLGWGAGVDGGPAQFNTFLGAGTGSANEHADFNTFVGCYAGAENNITNNTNNANRNTYLGTYAGARNRDGSNNVVIGAFADMADHANVPGGTILNEFETDGTGLIPRFGASVDTNVNRAVNIGALGYVTGNDAIAIGYSSQATANRSIAIGSNATTTDARSIAIGFGAVSHGADIAVIGNDSTLAWHPGADAVTELGDPNYRFTTVTAQGVDIIAAATSPASIQLWADDGVSNDDRWQVSAADGGDLTISSFVSGAYVAKFTVSNAGNVTIPGEISINSDARLKQDVRAIPNALDLLNRISGKTYVWKAGQGRDDHRHYGLLAQEVEAVLPELVSESTNGIKSVNYQALVPVLIEAVKASEQHKQAEIAALRAEKDAELNALRSEVEQLRSLRDEMSVMRAQLTKLTTQQDLHGAASSRTAAP